jgi:uncharacterized phage-associated protein
MMMSSLAAANFLVLGLLRQGQEISYRKLQALLFIAQCVSLHIGKKCFDEVMQARKNGPSCPSIYEYINRTPTKKITNLFVVLCIHDFLFVKNGVGECDTEIPIEENCPSLKFTLKNFSLKTEDQLDKITLAKDSPWAEHYNHNEIYNIVPCDTMRDYAQKIYGFAHDFSDIELEDIA